MVEDLVLFLAYCWLALVGVTLTIIDSAVHRLPDRLTALLAGGTLVSLGTQSIISNDAQRLVGSVAAGAGAAAFYLLMALLTGGGIGLGDAKLAFGLGLSIGWMGWPAVAAALFLALLLTGFAAVALTALGRAGRKDAIPHGPFMVIAAIMVVVALHGGLLDAV
ncbi:prepilin peptidase [Micromonospora sp. NPDC049900]|uniref:prepilin peptidase n=1 Tax=Micromonospora sp. NPDC049900 TaxID=3364275 RepID=UPI00379B6BB0